MKPISLFLLVGIAVTFSSCNSQNDAKEAENLKKETIAIHDEIMPQISSFDRETIRIDSILLSMDSLYKANPELDTAELRTELTELKGRLDGATDAMMTWMHEFETKHGDKTDAEIRSYYENELEKVKEMRAQFQEVSSETTEKMARFQQ